MRVALLGLALLVGCTGPATPIYEGERRPRSEVALLTDESSNSVFLIRVDDHDLVNKDDPPGRGKLRTVELLPGRHWVELAWVNEWRDETSDSATAGAVAAESLWLLVNIAFQSRMYSPVSGGFGKVVPVSLGTLGFHLEAEAGRCYRLKESPKGLTGSEFATKLARSLGWIYVGEAEFVGGSAVNVWLKVEG